MGDSYAYTVFDDVALHVMMTDVQRALLLLARTIVGHQFATQRAQPRSFLTMVTYLPKHLEGLGNIGAN